MAATLTISRNSGTGIAVDMPMGSKAPVSYKYQLEGDDLSAYTSAYTTTINLPKTHANCKAFNFPDNVGYGAVDTVDKFTYTYSVDIPAGGSFEDYGKCVIGSVTDTININLFSTVAEFATALDAATWPTSGYYKRSDGTDLLVRTDSEFRPCQATFDTSKGVAYTRSSFWDQDYILNTMDGHNTPGFLHYCMPDVGMPNDAICETATLDSNYAGYGKYRESTSRGDFTFLQAPLINIPSMPGYGAFQVKWYWCRLIMPIKAVLYNTVMDGYTLTLSDGAKDRLSSIYYFGPRIGDITSKCSDNVVRSIKDFYKENSSDLNDRFGRFYAHDVLDKMELPGAIIKRVCKQFNLRFKQTSASTIQICTTAEWYGTSSSVTDISSLIDRSKYEVAPHSFKYSNIIFEGEGLDTAVLSSYKDTTGNEFNRGSYTTGYPVTSEKKWFGDSYKYVTSYPHEYTNVPWVDGSDNAKKINVNCIGAYDSDAKEVDISGCIECLPTFSRLECYILGDVSTSLERFEPYQGYYANRFDASSVVINCLAVAGENVGSTGYVMSPNTANFVYGEPQYKIAGQVVTNLFQYPNNWFADVKDCLASSLVTTNVMFGSEYTSMSSVINKMYFFDNNYWVVWSIDSFIPGSKEPCEITFVKVNDISNYIDHIQSYSNSVTVDHGTVTVKVNGTTIGTPSSFTTVTGDTIDVTVSNASGYLIDKYVHDGTTYDITPPVPSYSFSAADGIGTYAFTSTSIYTLTATAGSHGSVTPASATLVPGGYVTIIATPDDGYMVQSWTDNGVTTATHDSTYTINNISASHTVSVAFMSDACQVTVQAYDGSTTTPDTGGKVSIDGTTYERHLTASGHYGESITIMQRPDSGYKFDHWATSGGAYISASETLEYGFTQAADTVRAVFWPTGVSSYALILTSGEGIGNTYGFGTYGQGARVPIDCDLEDGYAFDGWYDGDTRIATTQSYTYTMPASNKTLQARATSSGQVVLNFHGVNCTCSPDHHTGDPGTTVIVTVTPTAGYSWGSWNDGSIDNPRTFTLSTSMVYTATCITPQSKTLTFDASEGGSVSPTTYTGVTGSTVTVTATPDTDYEFIRWDDGSTDNPRTFTVGSISTTYKALFHSELVTLTLQCTNGDVIPVKSTVRPGTVITANVYPFTSYVFDKWSDGNTDNPRNFTVNADVTFTAQCKLGSKYTLTLDYSGPAGMPAPTLTGAGQYYEGTAVRISSTIPTGYAFIGWYKGSTEITKTRDVYITKLASAETYTAHFKEDKEITYTFKGDHGTCSPSSFQGWPGDTVSVTVTPQEFYHFVEWDDHNTSNPRTFTIGDTDVEWTATCGQDAKYTLTLNYTPSSMPAPTLTGAGSYYDGEAVMINATIPSGWAFVGWYRGSTLVSTTRNIYITKLASNETLTAHYEEDKDYTLTFNGSNCTCTPPSFTGRPGDSVTVDVLPAIGYEWDSWDDGSTDNPRDFMIGTSDVTYTASCVTEDKHTIRTMSYPDTSYGTTSGDGRYRKNDTVTITATPASGHSFLMWVDYTSGTAVSYSSTYTFTMDGEDHIFEARFS